MKRYFLLVPVAIGMLAAAVVLTGSERESFPDLRLSDFPWTFKESTMIVIGSNASEIEIQAANEIAEYLENETGNKPLIKKYSEVTEENKRNYNLIVVGTPNFNPMLKEIYAIADVLEVNETYPREGKGVLEIARNPWNENKILLLAESSDSLWIKKAACLLTSYSELLQMDKLGSLLRDGVLNSLNKKRTIYYTYNLEPIVFLKNDKSNGKKNYEYIDDFCEIKKIIKEKGNDIEKIDVWWYDHERRKISPVVAEQILYEKSLNETIKVYLHFYDRPNHTELSKLEVLGVKIKDNSCIPHSYDAGWSCSAEIPVNKVVEVTKFDFIQRIGPAEGLPTALMNVDKVVER